MKTYVLAEARRGNRTIIVEKKMDDGEPNTPISVKEVTIYRFSTQKRARQFCEERFNLSWPNRRE